MPRVTVENFDQIKSDHHEKLNWVRVGLSSCGIAAGAKQVYDTFKEGLEEQGFAVELKQCGCAGSCYLEPLVEISIEGMEPVTYGQVNTEIAQWLIDAHIGRKRIVEKYRIPGIKDISDDVSLLPSGQAKQYRSVLRNCGVVDPSIIDDYIARDGFKALAKCLTEMTPEEVIQEIDKSGLRGRGGAGYPTGLKWRLTKKTQAPERFMICNGDEGDPGAYMDRSVLEGDPFSLIEGMSIAGYAIGANRGFFYIRAEYPLAVERIESAIKQAKQYGLLGRNIFGTGFDYDLEVRLGAGAFVCGEETALIASIEGKRGSPVPRPPFPSVRGLWDMPTCINNVETLANVPNIIRRGPDWFSSIGLGKSKGTKVFAVTGKVSKSGLIEVPMGITLRQIVIDICGGTLSGKPVKAIQTGGPSGGVIPESLFDTPVSYEHLLGLGSIMGSGGLIVMEEGDSMVDIAKFYLGFCVDESCGKCAPCRLGGKQMHLILERICAGNGCKEDIDNLHKISVAMQKGSLCGLGQTAPNPVISTLRYFEKEYQDAISKKV